MNTRFAWLAILSVVASARSFADDFAVAVVRYDPAPGQFVNNPSFNDPARALGPPVGGGTLASNNSKLVSLGGFGGSITLRFDPPISDDPCNPFGLDLIVHGNAFWVGANPNRRFAEAGVIEVSADANNNGLADDPWFVIPGSHLPNAPPAAVPADAIESQPWDNDAGTPVPPALSAWYPIGAPPSFVTMGFGLPALFDASVIQNPNGLASSVEGVWGYADWSPTLLRGDLNADNIVEAPGTLAEEFYTTPDNPFEVGITPGAGGGDAMDLAWAVDPVTGAPASLLAAHFVRITNAVNFVSGALGEISSEIGAVADVRSRESFFDRTGDARADIEDLYAWHELRAQADPAADLNGDASIGEPDRALMQRCVRREEENP